MATDFLNDARREIEGRTEDFYKELREFYRGESEAEKYLPPYESGENETYLFPQEEKDSIFKDSGDFLQNLEYQLRMIHIGRYGRADALFCYL